MPDTSAQVTNAPRVNTAQSKASSSSAVVASSAPMHSKPTDYPSFCSYLSGPITSNSYSMESLVKAFGKQSAPVLSAADIIAKQAASQQISDARTKKRQRSGSNASDSSGELVSKVQKKATAVKDDEEKQKRTVFVGNVPLSVSAKALARHFQSYLKAQPNYETWAAPKRTAGEQAQEEAASTARTEGQTHKGLGCRDVESVRFRSVPIAPTKVAPGSDYKHMIKASVVQGLVGPAVAAGMATAAGKQAGAAGAGKGGVVEGTTQAGKARESQNAYIVFRTLQAATLALALNGTTLEGHHLRVDSAESGGIGDYKRTLFCGNLPYTASEDDVRAYFGGCVSGGQQSVEAVRIVRDKITQSGKGIAYVTFRERSHVAEALGCVEGKPFAGRTLRVQRAKPMTKGSSEGAQGQKEGRPHEHDRKRQRQHGGGGGEHSFKPQQASSGGGPCRTSGASAGSKQQDAAPVPAMNAAAGASSTKPVKIKLPSFAGARGEDVEFRHKAKKGEGSRASAGGGGHRGGGGHHAGQRGGRGAGGGSRPPHSGDAQRGKPAGEFKPPGASRAGGHKKNRHD